MPYLQYLGLDDMGDRRGIGMSLMEQAPIPGAQSCVPSSYISLTNTPYLPVVDSVWQWDRGVWMGQSWLNTHPSGRIPTATSPPFSKICPRCARWGIPLIGVLSLTLIPVHIRWHSEDLWPCDDPPDHPHDGWAADWLRWRGRGEEPLLFA